MGPPQWGHASSRGFVSLPQYGQLIICATTVHLRGGFEATPLHLFAGSKPASLRPKRAHLSRVRPRLHFVSGNCVPQCLQTDASMPFLLPQFAHFLKKSEGTLAAHINAMMPNITAR
jgi:hypothetical protein